MKSFREMSVSCFITANAQTWTDTFMDLLNMESVEVPSFAWRNVAVCRETT